jgi:hypothetical protein
MGNIIWGLIIVGLGLSENFVLVGTNSSGALVAAGIALMVWGALRTAEQSQTTEEDTAQEPAEVHNEGVGDDDRVLMHELHDADVFQSSRHGSADAQARTTSAQPQIVQDV